MIYASLRSLTNRFYCLRFGFSDGVERVVAFSQYPQYSCTTSGSSFNAIAAHYNKTVRGGLAGVDSIEPPKSQAGGIPARPGPIWSFLDRWPTSMPQFAEVMAENIRQELAHMPAPYNEKDTVILFSAHSVPMSIVNRGDPYVQASAAFRVSKFTKPCIFHFVFKPY